MKTKIVDSADISAERGLRAQDYFLPDADAPCWQGMRTIARLCHETAKSKGWWEAYEGRSLTPDEVAAKLALIHSEVSEALEEIRENDGELYLTGPPIAGVLGSPRPIVPEDQLARYKEGDLKPEGFPSELADILVRVFDLAGKFDFDLVEVMRLKMLYNERRSYKHGGKKL